MTDGSMQGQRAASYLFGGNAAYIEELYEQYLKDPQSIDPSFRQYFAKLKNGHAEVSHSEIRAYFQHLATQPRVAVNGATAPASSDVSHERKQAQVMRLIEAYRLYGHYHAKLDPLGLAGFPPALYLDLSCYGLTDADLNAKFSAGDLLLGAQLTLKEICALLERIYCGTLGAEYKYIADSRQVEWIRERIESQQGRPAFSKETKLRILKRLAEAEGLERYLGAKYVGQTRFSVEGADSLMPLIDELVERAAGSGAKEIVVGMGHRGRINILVNIFGKNLTEIFLEFEGKRVDQEGSGDVKYHIGLASDVATAHGEMHLALAFNPSHLEIIDPVIEGAVRARQEARGDSEYTQVIPLLIHGDAAFAGQGVVMETFAFSQARGYKTGGTVHVVVNNQIGFTTSNPQDSRSSWYCTDIAKMVQAPIFHVNGDDPEAVVFAAQLALDFRQTFKKDVVIDLVCYRKHGHNEGDEPSATQPVMYQKIKQHPTAYRLYADKLIAEGIIKEEQVAALIDDYRALLDTGTTVVKTLNGKNHSKHAVNWTPYFNQKWTAPADTAVSLKELQQLAKQLETATAGMTLQPQVAKIFADRQKMTAGELPIDWGYAETMAYATLLQQGHAVRISGEDCGRGTFAHRHAVLHDYQTGRVAIPLQKIAQAPTAFTIFDSILSEEAVLGFEYGYATASPEELVIWEAQYGDFVNGAQIVIDQFISSGEQKWGRLCGLTLLLPHGHEGAGPEHSSARVERFLQLCAQDNMQVCVPSNAAQIFHLLRRQILRPYRKPLIVITPKSLLRHNLAKASLKDLTAGRFQNVIAEIDEIDANQARRVILCSGKVYYDLLEKRRADQQKDVALVRVEQLYPFPETEIAAEIQRYKKAKDIVWCQEEPHNQGAWSYMQPRLLANLAKGQTLRYIGRPEAASTATGYKSVHSVEQKALITEALG